ncbi:MAG: ABC transporter substrate-binding protein [Balneolaceae bacterium]
MAKNYHHPLLTFIITIFFLILFHACGPSGTVTVVEDDPETTPADSEADTSETGGDFQQLTIGLIDPVTNFDPLFADNLSTMRVLSLIFEGLYTLNPEGEPVPSLVRDLEISENGLEYTFTIDREVLFHDSRIFSSGIGRRIHADDIKRVFERSAKVDVPETASAFLMNIEGYKNFFLEQRTVYDENKRVLEGVEGIQVESPGTVVFTLNEEDPMFLHKLASPYFLIYPHESLQENSNGLEENPVGTGPYSFSGRDENQIMLIHQNGNEQEQAINRINLVYYNSEGDLFQGFAGQDIDWIPEIGPRTHQQVFDNVENVSNSYSEEFDATRHDAFRITSIYANNNTTAEADWFFNRLNSLTEEDFSIQGEYDFQDFPMENSEEAEPDSSYYIPFTDSKFAQNLFSDLQEAAFEPESSLAYYNIRARAPSTVLYYHTSDSFHNEWNPVPSDYWLQLSTRILSLYQHHLDGIQSSAVPWLIHIENIRLNSSVNNLQ